VSTDTPIQVTVELDSLADPIHGTLTDEAGTPRPFSGWTGLLAALDTVINKGKRPDPD
jgi:hypothetical protein